MIVVDINVCNAGTKHFCPCLTTVVPVTARITLMRIPMAQVRGKARRNMFGGDLVINNIKKEMFVFYGL